MTKYFFNKPFYPYLHVNDDKPNLSLSKHVPNWSEQLTVCYQQKYRYFTSFSNYIAFLNFIRQIPYEHCCFYEVIPGHRHQKFKLDIDSPITQEYTLQNLLDIITRSVLLTFEDMGIHLNICRDILWFSSTTCEKYSLHLVVDNYMCNNHVQAGKIAQEVIKNVLKVNDNQHLATCIQKCIDPKVYSSLQQFRIVANRKYAKNNVKKLLTCWQYKEEHITYEYVEKNQEDLHTLAMQLEASLITHTKHCSLLPYNTHGADTVDNPSSDVSQSSCVNIANVNKHLVKISLELLVDHFSLPYKHVKFPFAFQKIQDGFIHLRRKKPFYCKMCRKIHHKENGLMFLVGNNPYDVYFSCRRSEVYNQGKNVKAFLGQIYDEQPVDKEVTKRVTKRKTKRIKIHSPKLEELNTINKNEKAKPPLNPNPIETNIIGKYMD